MIVGKPIIATDVTGVRSVLEGGLASECLLKIQKKHLLKL